MRNEEVDKLEASALIKSGFKKECVANVLNIFLLNYRNLVPPFMAVQKPGGTLKYCGTEDKPCKHPHLI